MTVARRLAVVESSLTPTQLVLRWLDEAHAHGSFTAYSEALLDAELDDLPINRLCREARRSALSTVRTRSSEEEAKAVAKAMRQTLFRYFLVLRINVTTHELLEKETYIHAAMASFVAMLAGETEPGDDHRDRLAHACRVVMGRVTVLEGAADARTLAEERYLDGRNVLFPNLVPAWDAQVQSTREHAAMTLRLAELDGVDVTLPGDDDAEASAGIEASLADLVEPAKATALEKLGDGERGLQIVRSWLRAKLDATGAEAARAEQLGPSL